MQIKTEFTHLFKTVRDPVQMCNAVKHSGLCSRCRVESVRINICNCHSVSDKRRFMRAHNFIYSSRNRVCVSYTDGKLDTVRESRVSSFTLFFFLRSTLHDANEKLFFLFFFTLWITYAEFYHPQIDAPWKVTDHCVAWPLLIRPHKMCFTGVWRFAGGRLRPRTSAS